MPPAPTLAPSTPPSSERAAGQALSPRERDVLRLLAHGPTDKETARRLGISHGTVRVYRGRLQDKLGVRGTALCVAVAWKRGELDLDAIADEAARALDAPGSPSP